MNTNNIYFIQTKNVNTDVRQGWIISSPRQDWAEAYLPEAGWVDIDNTIIISSELVDYMVDTDEAMAGETYIKVHN